MDNIEIPPSSRKLVLNSDLHQIKCEISFKNFDSASERDIDALRAFEIQETDNVLFCYFKGTLAFPKKILFKDDRIEFGGVTISGSRASNCGTGIHIV